MKKPHITPRAKHPDLDKRNWECLGAGVVFMAETPSQALRLWRAETDQWKAERRMNMWALCGRRKFSEVIPIEMDRYFMWGNDLSGCLRGKCCYEF